MIYNISLFTPTSTSTNDKLTKITKGIKSTGTSYMVDTMDSDELVEREGPIKAQRTIQFIVHMVVTVNMIFLHQYIFWYFDVVLLYLSTNG